MKLETLQPHTTTLSPTIVTLHPNLQLEPNLLLLQGRRDHQWELRRCANRDIPLPHFVLEQNFSTFYLDSRLERHH